MKLVVTLAESLGSLSVQVRPLPWEQSRATEYTVKTRGALKRSAVSAVKADCAPRLHHQCNGRQEMEKHWIEPVVEFFDWPDWLVCNEDDYEEFLQSIEQG